MERIAIIGLGLIGTSIGLGLRDWAARERRGSGGTMRIVGFDTDLLQQQTAKRMKAVNETSWDLPSTVRDADLVIVATPVGAVREVFVSIGDHLKHGSVVTDTCSTKAQVMTWARETLPTTTSFVGGHPLAGKTQSTEAAEGTLFQGATWCLCPTVKATESAVNTVLGMVAALGAAPQFIDPSEHDGFVGAVSHLPFLLSSVLMHTVSTGPAWREMKTLTASGFRDVSRLAAGSPEMYRDICLTNRESMLRWIDEYSAALGEMRALLADEGTDQASVLQTYFTEARDARADWATAERSDGQLLQVTETELSRSSLGGQFSQMLLGGFARRRPAGPLHGNDTDESKRPRPDRT